MRNESGQFIKGSVNTFNPKNRVKVNCGCCGKELEKCPCHLKTQKNFFCSRECKKLWMKSNPKCYEKWLKSGEEKLFQLKKDPNFYFEIGKKISKTVEQLWKDSEFRSKAEDGMKKSAEERWSDLEYREIHSKNLSKAFLKSELHKIAAINNFKKASEVQKELFKNPEWVMKWVESCSTRTKHFYSEKNKKELYYHSSYELEAFKKLEKLENVKVYDRCRFSIPYEFEEKQHWYIPDIIVTYQDGNKEIIEIKSCWAVYININVAKFRAAENFCNVNNMKFNVWTERELICQ